MHDKQYKPVVSDLTHRLKKEVQLIEQWKKHDQWLPNQLEHYYKALALLELLENITVFNIGFGYTKCDRNSRGFNTRCQTFFDNFL